MGSPPVPARIREKKLLGLEGGERYCQIPVRWGPPPGEDLFATLYNRKLPSYVSPFPDEEAVAVDALALSWDNLIAYAFPPFAILKKVVQKLEQSVNCKMVLVAPHWPNQSWFAVLTKLSQVQPIRLPLWHDLLKQPVQDLYHQNLELLDLHAWSLYSGT